MYELLFQGLDNSPVNCAVSGTETKHGRFLDSYLPPGRGRGYQKSSDSESCVGGPGGAESAEFIDPLRYEHL